MESVDFNREKLISELLWKHENLALQDANEAETRLKLIDEIIFNVLGWLKEDVTVEERVSEDNRTTYTDYIIRTANTAIIVEAKRIGATFHEIPDKNRTLLSGKIMKGSTGEAIIQARDYCRSKSIEFAVVTNGHQWIIFPGTRTDQVEFKKSTAIIFGSLSDALSTDLEYFNSLLSRDGVINGYLSKELLGRNDNQIEERRLKTLSENPRNKHVNPLYPHIESAIVTALTDTIVGDDPILLQKCYVQTADRTKFDRRIHMHLSKREPLFDSQPVRPLSKRQHADYLKNSIEAAENAARSLAILVMGPVGAGKTTFINYTKRISNSKFFEPHTRNPYPHWIEMDFRTFSERESSIDFIYTNIFDYLISDPYFKDYKRSIEPAYKTDIESLTSGPGFLLAGNPEALTQEIYKIIHEDYKSVNKYVDKLIKHAGKLKPIFLVIDNVDQFSDEKQSEIFSDSIALASRLNINLVMAMRETTYVNHRHQAIFDAFDFDPIQIESPDIKAVLSRRLYLAKELLKDKQGSFTTPGGILFNVEDLSIFIDILQNSILETEVGTRIEVLSNGDIRLALRMTREFIERGYTDPAKAITSFSQNKNYVLPKHEAFRSILLGNQAVYSEQYSVIGNPFDSRLYNTNAQLLRIYVLAALVRFSSEAGFQYIEGVEVKSIFNKLGFSDEAALHVLTDLCKLRFIDSASHLSPSLQCNYFPTRLGGYFIKSLISDLTFIENVMLDTFIASTETWEQLKGLSKAIRNERKRVQKIKLRTQKALVFYEHMMELYSTLNNESLRRSLPSEWCTNPLSEQHATFKSNLKSVISSANKYYN